MHLHLHGIRCWEKFPVCNDYLAEVYLLRMLLCYFWTRGLFHFDSNNFWRQISSVLPSLVMDRGLSLSHTCQLSRHSAFPSVNFVLFSSGASLTGTAALAVNMEKPIPHCEVLTCRPSILLEDLRNRFKRA